MQLKTKKMHNSMRLIAIMLILVFVLSACNITEKRSVQQTDVFPKENVQTASHEPRAIGKPVQPTACVNYKDIIADYWDVFYADWEEPLTANALWDMGLPEQLLNLTSEQIDNFGYCIKDVNFDDIPELFFGIKDGENIKTFYQAYTLINGKPYPFFTINEIDTLYLRSNGTVLNERTDMDGNQWCAVYSINGKTACKLEEGISDSGGTCRLFDANSNDTKISREKFGQKLQSYYCNLVKVDYDLLSAMLSRSTAIEDDPEPDDNYVAMNDNSITGHVGITNSNSVDDTVVIHGTQNDDVSIESNGNEQIVFHQDASGENAVGVVSQIQESDMSAGFNPAPKQGINAQTEDAIPMQQSVALQPDSSQWQRFTHTIFYDMQMTMAPTASVLVPYGWNGNMYVDWSFMSTSSPGVAMVELTSPDGARIVMVSNMAYVDNTINGARVAEGQDSGLYCTTKHYCVAQALQESSLATEGYYNAQLIEQLEVPNSWTEMIETAAKVKAENLTQQGMYVYGYEGTAAFNHYRDGQTEIAVLTMVMGAGTYSSTSRIQMDSIMWCVPIQFWFIAPNQTVFENNFDTFLTVMGNSDFTSDFLFMNLKIGNAISDGIHAGLMQQAYDYINSNTDSWLNEYQSSDGYDSSKWAEEWGDVIKDQQAYATEDGGTIKVDTKYDAVYQNGNEIYMGPDGQSPDGWTKLYPTRN